MTTKSTYMGIARPLELFYFCKSKTRKMTLNDLHIGESAKVLSVGGEKELRQHFLDMGIIPGAELTLIKYAPLGDPMQVLVHGYELTFRLSDAEKITVEKCASRAESYQAHEDLEFVQHPGLGESSPVYHDYVHNGQPKVRDSDIVFALVGNQNCGKTTLFNQLTGMNQHVGNFPGVTVETKSGGIKNYPKMSVVDLPGIYSLSPYSQEEVVTREFILKSRPTAIINIVDATNIERNLYLTMQLMELDIPMVLALNMMDELNNNGGSVHINVMEKMLGIPVIPISAISNKGVDELIEHAVHIARYQECPGKKDFCSPGDHGGAVHRSLHGVMHLIEDHAVRAGIPVRFAGSKLIEGDALVQNALRLNDREAETVALILKQLEEERGLDAAAAIADMRFSFIEKVCRKAVVKPQKSKEHIRSLQIDRILTGKWTAVPAFLLIMVFIFWMTFDVIGGNLQGVLEDGIGAFSGWLDHLLTVWNINGFVHSLVIDGVINGVGAVLSFIPIIVTLFFFLSLLEDSGYMARIAFVMDKMLRKLGLSGRSIVPLLMGFGCSVPSVMSSRTLPSERDRKLTVLLTPFMSCTAKLPIYAFFTALFFPENGTVVMVVLYLLGILVGICLAFVLKYTLFKGEPVPFVMELPNYRIPGMKSVSRLIWDKASDFLQRAFSVIFIASVVIWFLQTFDYKFQIVVNSQDSILANLAGWIAPVFAPLGLEDWRVVTSLISGFLAKESVVSTFTVLFGTGTAITSVMSSATAFGLLVFCLLYTPCVATIATVRHEMGSKFAVTLVVWQCVIAWVCAFLARWLCMAI